MRLIIAGTRDLRNAFELVESGLNHFYFRMDPITEIVCGMSGTVDLAGKKYAEREFIKFTPMEAEWDKYGKPAGPLRNKKMAKYADNLLLIWDGRSPGSYDMRKNMLSEGKSVYEITLREGK